jgi:hypothetical protein
MAYNGIQQIVYRTSDGLVLRFGHCDFVSQDDFDGGVESIVENDYKFPTGLRDNEYIWTGSTVNDNGAYIKKNQKQILEEIETAATAQQWLDVQEYIDSHCMVLCYIDRKQYVNARARIQKAYDDTDISLEVYTLLMAAIPTEDTP